MQAIDLSGKVAVITGAGSGLGAATALCLAEAGADVLLHFHGAGRIEEIASAARALGRRVETVAGDFATDPGMAAEVVRKAVRRLGTVDILVNNAALTTLSEPLETHSRGGFETTLAVNVTAVFLATQAAAQAMIARGAGGRIINIGSVHARQSAPGSTAYEVSKGAVHALTFSAAVALGRHGITVNCVAPGAIVVERYAALENFDTVWYTSRTPVGRLGVPEDIGNAVVFLASPGAGYISGETLYVDGGMTRRMPLVK
jgi:NAD(P)-dependent dehydrogenase (short-subunit alcohol dehydrogenase family)